MDDRQGFAALDYRDGVVTRTEHNDLFYHRKHRAISVPCAHIAFVPPTALVRVVLVHRGVVLEKLAGEVAQYHTEHYAGMEEKHYVPVTEWTVVQGDATWYKELPNWRP
jgi:hypothetical protein